jgi:low temperature requirement protein LtrA
MLSQCILAVIPSAIWVGSIHVEMPHRFILIWIAIVIDLCAPIILPLFMRNSRYLPKKLADLVDKAFEFTPAVSIEHRVERTNAFVALVFGYSVVAIMYQNAADYGVNAFFGKAALGLIQAFCFNWIYFELDGDDLYQHAIRRNVNSGT